MRCQLSSSAGVVVLGPSHLLPHSHQFCVMLGLDPVEAFHSAVETFECLVAFLAQFAGPVTLQVELGHESIGFLPHDGGLLFGFDTSALGLGRHLLDLHELPLVLALPHSRILGRLGKLARKDDNFAGKPIRTLALLVALRPLPLQVGSELSRPRLHFHKPRLYHGRIPLRA